MSKRPVKNSEICKIAARFAALINSVPVTAFFSIYEAVQKCDEHKELIDGGM